MSLQTAAEKQRLATKRALKALGEELGEDQATLEALYKAARDENELLEFKNYELQFKIQELESKQRNLLSAISSRCTSAEPKQDGLLVSIDRRQTRRLSPLVRFSASGSGR